MREKQSEQGAWDLRNFANPEFAERMTTKFPRHIAVLYNACCKSLADPHKDASDLLINVFEKMAIFLGSFAWSVFWRQDWRVFNANDSARKLREEIREKLRKGKIGGGEWVALLREPTQFYQDGKRALNPYPSLAEPLFTAFASDGTRLAEDLDVLVTWRNRKIHPPHQNLPPEFTEKLHNILRQCDWVADCDFLVPAAVDKGIMRTAYMLSGSGDEEQASLARAFELKIESSDLDDGSVQEGLTPLLVSKDQASTCRFIPFFFAVSPTRPMRPWSCLL